MFEITVENNESGDQEKVRCALDSCELGKSKDSILRVRGWKVAPRHVSLEKNLAGIFVKDISRGFGIKVNGSACVEFGPMKETDVIEFGSYKVSVRVSVTEQQAEANEALAKDDELLDMAHVEANEAVSFDRPAYMEWTKFIHKELMKQLDLRRLHLDELTPEQVREQLSALLEKIIAGIKGQLPATVDSDKLLKIVLDETVGLGALEELLADKDVTEVMVNCHDDIYVERAGRLEKTDVTFSSPDAVMSTIERIVSPLGRRIDESSPMVDARLQDGSRVNAIIPPLALRGPCITIRKFPEHKLVDSDLIRFGTLNEAMVSFVRMAVEQRLNIVVSGGTGSGKTTLLNILSNYIPLDERVITVEDAAELKLVQPHVIALEARPANMEGKGQVTIRELVKNCLRMRPDRIVVGECRGGEALDMLQAMNTGHDGSLTTGHANTPRDMLRRLEVMVLMAGMDLPVMAIREQVASAVDIIIQQNRFSDGSRRITSITEVTGMSGDTVQLSEIFRFQQKGFDGDGKIIGEFKATGLVPKFYEDLREKGVDIDMGIFK
ncbi:MAG: ATPase, T2SS/T4P/T4SS family [Porticoccaceae bacterium]|nr:ATPase, T2SS/T4P/T4SS family [Porticoccaceae bacterium]MDG1307753.1 ATPase, T2SS/T4P/T4SS family [Porticoccaceae bacterium]